MLREQEILRVRVEKADLEETIEDLRARDERSSAFFDNLICTSLTSIRLDEKIASLEQTVQELRAERADFLQILHAHEQRHQCEVLYAGDHIIDAAKLLLEIVNTTSQAARANKLIMDWLAGEFWDCDL